MSVGYVAQWFFGFLIEYVRNDPRKIRVVDSLNENVHAEIFIIELIHEKLKLAVIKIIRSAGLNSNYQNRDFLDKHKQYGID